MKKYLVDVYLPACGKHCDVLLPAGKRISEITRLLSALAERLSEGSYEGGQSAMLLDAESGEPFPAEETVYDVGIRNASGLILI